MGWGCWNKIKKNILKAKGKILPVIKKGVQFYKDNKELIDAGARAIAPKLGISEPTLRQLQLLGSNYDEPPDDDYNYPDSGGMITPKYK